MKVSITVGVEEVKGEPTAVGQKPLRLNSHWNQDGICGLVVLTTPKGEEFSVRAQELKDAIDRCVDL